MATKYRAYDVDNPWYQAISYNTWNYHIDTDQLMNCRFPAGMGGSRNFGKIASLIQAAILNRLGWFEWNGSILSTLFVLASIAFWNLFLANLGWLRTSRLLFLLSLGLLEPFVSMASKSRYEFFSFFVLSVSLWLASKHLNLLAIFLSFLATETQPIGIVVPIAILLFLLFREKARLRILIYFTAASLIGLVAYIWLHPLGLTTMMHADWTNRTNAPLTFGFLSSYFLERKRHLPELVALLFAAVVYWRRRKSIQSHFAVTISLVVVVVSCVIRANVAYMVFLYPFILLAAWPLLRTRKSQTVAAVLVVLFVLPQYGFLYYVNRHEGYGRQDLISVSKAIGDGQASMRLSDDQVHIFGDYGLWYAHPRNYVGNGPWTHDSLGVSNIVLCYSGPIESFGLIDSNLMYCPDILSLGRFKEFEDLTVRGHVLHVLTAAQSSAESRP
jgi:hypothetical protein